MKPYEQALDDQKERAIKLAKGRRCPASDTRAAIVQLARSRFLHSASISGSILRNRAFRLLTMPPFFAAFRCQRLMSYTMLAWILSTVVKMVRPGEGWC